MAIDPGIYAQAGRPSVELQNPLQIAGQAAQVAAGVNANRLFQAQTARGQAMQQAIDPTTGALDLGKFNRLIAADPTAAPAAPGALGQSTELAGQQQQQGLTRNEFLMRGLGAVTNLPDDQLHSGLALFAHRAETVGGIDPLEVKTVLASLPNDPSSLRTALRQAQMSLQAPGDQQAITYGAGGIRDDGQTMQPVINAHPVNGGGQFAVGPATPKLTGPETLAAIHTVTVEDPQRPGTYIQVPVPRSELPGADGKPAPMGTGGYKPAGRPLAAAPPGANDAIGADVAAYKKDQAVVPAANTAVQNLQHAYDALQLSQSGKSTETTHAMYSLLNAQGLLPQGLADDVKNYDLFKKYTEKYAATQGDRSGTDAGRAMAAASNAGTGFSAAANMDVLRNEIGRQNQAIAQVAEHKDPSGVGYGSHAAAFASATDPRGFAISKYSPEEVQKMVAGMKDDAERKRFYKSAGIAKRLGLVDAPSGQ